MSRGFSGKVNIEKFIHELPVGDCVVCPSLGEDVAVISTKNYI